MRLLCVEGNVTLRKMIDLMLATTGIDVDFAPDGPSALEAYQVNEYDAVLMDLEIPEMSGLQAAREIRRMEGGYNLSYTPILFIGAQNSPVQAEAGYEAGGDGLLNKPFTSAALIGALNGVLYPQRGATVSHMYAAQ